MLYFFTAKAVPTGKDIFLFVPKDSVRSFVCFMSDLNKTTNLFYLTVKLGLDLDMEPQVFCWTVKLSVFRAQHNKCHLRPSYELSLEEEHYCYSHTNLNLSFQEPFRL